MRTSQLRGQSIVGVLVVLVIIMALYLFFLRGNTGSGPVGPHGEQTIAKAAMNKASGVECMSNLRSIRQAMTMYEQTNEKKPAALTDLSQSGIASGMLSCPIVKQPYRYVNGAVQCPDPVHARY